MTTPVLLDITDGVAKITLNRPEKDNALDQPMADALLATALHCSNDSKVRCVVLTGAGKMFCVGGYISERASNGDAITPFLTRLAGTLHHGHIASGAQPVRGNEQTDDHAGEWHHCRGRAEGGNLWRYCTGGPTGKIHDRLSGHRGHTGWRHDMAIAAPYGHARGISGATVSWCRERHRTGPQTVARKFQFRLCQPDGPRAVFNYRCRKWAGGAERHQRFPGQTQTELSGQRVIAPLLSTPQETSA